MFSDNGKISARQLQCLIIADFTAVFLAIFPLVMFGKSTDGVVAEIIIAFAVGTAILYGVSKITAKKKNEFLIKV